MTRPGVCFHRSRAAADPAAVLPVEQPPPDYKNLPVYALRTFSKLSVTVHDSESGARSFLGPSTYSATRRKFRRMSLT
jgi:hypothetical protein